MSAGERELHDLHRLRGRHVVQQERAELYLVRGGALVGRWRIRLRCVHQRQIYSGSQLVRSMRYWTLHQQLGWPPMAIIM